MTPAQMFLCRMQWRPAGSSVPEPVVALLGPPGSGKSTTLRALSRECGGTVVHASLDFAEHSDLDSMSAVAFVAFSLMRGWTNLRRRPVFHRLGLCLMALNENLNPNRAIAQQQIKELIRQYVQRQPVVRVGERVPNLLFNATEVAAAVSGITNGAAVRAIQEQAKPVIGALFRGAARWGLRGALGWYHTIPEAEDAGTIDSLIALSTTHRPNALNHMMKALLADIDDFTRKHRPASAKCDCVIPEDVPDHDHVWVLLLDNAQSAVGEQFLQALIKARQERVQSADRAPVNDPLLVATAVDRWKPAWGRWWREPWQTAARAPTRQPIPLFSEASWAQWAGHAAGSQVNAARGWYPVWLDPASGDGGGAPPDQLVSRLAGGHPLAAITVRAELEALDPSIGGDQPGAILDACDDAGIPLWERAVQACSPGLVPERPWSEVPPAVAVAARLSEPARPVDDLSGDRFPEATQTLRDLRAQLWVSTFAARPSPLWIVGRGVEEPPAAMHPWLARSLLAGLTAESDSGRSLWEDLFAALLDGESEPNRVLFRDLAQGRFATVAKELVERFDVIEHRAWIQLLDDTTSAPCRLPAAEPLAVSYRRLAPDHVTGRSPVEAAVTSLTALLWLYRDPLSMPAVLSGPALNVPWHEQVRKDFSKLAHSSGRADVSALEEAASQFESLT